MRKLFLAAVLTALSFSAYGQALTEADREKLLTHLDITSANFQKAVDGLSDAQWNFRAAEGRWTIAEVAEHITAAEKLIRDGAVATMKTPATPEQLKDARKEDVLVARVPDRSKKFQAPEPLIPTNRFRSPAETMAAFRAERAQTMKLVREGGDLRSYAGENPVVGNLDTYGWLIFLSAHSERHTKQLLEVKADPNFPKN